MAGTYFKLNDREVRRDLKAFMRQAGDLSPAYKAFGEYMLNVTGDRFSGEHSPEGRAWQPLSPETLESKKGAKILTESGQLRNSIIYSAKPERFAYGTNKIYGAIHQFGGKAGRGRKVTIPARPYLGIAAADMEEFGETLRDHLEDR
ncbi:MAG: phage virion morphogenesis protein [Desulfobacterales bacterium]|nr:phage virion morphogenesis protein [Desulfobacterales bacterium]